jgi:predicted RNase H-like HicB family nuclease
MSHTAASLVSRSSGKPRRSKQQKTVEELRRMGKIKGIGKIPLREGIATTVKYREKAIEKAEYKKVEDGTWFAEIPGFQGVWAKSDTVEECRKELIKVLEEWLVLKLRDQNPIPEINGLRLDIREMAVAKS